MNSLFARLLLTVLASITLAHAIAILVVTEEHRRQLFGSWMLHLPVAALGVYLASRAITRHLSKLVDEAERMGRNTTEHAISTSGPSEMRAVARAFDSAQDRVTQTVSNRFRMLAAISHDIRAPLTRMRLRVESLSDDEERRRLTRDLDEMADMMNATLNLLKEMSEDESTEAIDMNQLIEDLRTQFTEMGRYVAVRGQARRPYVGRARALKRCLANLIDNAVKFGEYASITLEDGNALRVRITDGGPGIPQEEIDRVFEPFYRAHSPATARAGGAGLGLAIARDIVLGHGGRLTLRNRPTRGLIAEIVLPRGG
ncbi:MAG TPA: ATP-binding protein [Steroidobacteraceae bacterium]